MNLHTAIRDFTDSYDREAISHIQALATDSSIRHSKFLFEAVDIKKSADLFIEYLEGFAKYKMTPEGNDTNDIDVILERTDMFLDRRVPGGGIPPIFETTKIHPYEVPTFCTDYLESVQKVIDKIECLSSEMLESYVTNDAVGALCEMGDKYVSYLYPKVGRISPLFCAFLKAQLYLLYTSRGFYQVSMRQNPHNNSAKQVDKMPIFRYNRLATRKRSVTL